MFETYEESRLNLPLGLGRLLWGYVRVPLQNPWFHVQYSLTDESGDRFAKTVFLSTVDQLLDISQHENVQLERVYLVSPEHVNGAGRWKMEPLHQILHRQIEVQQSWHGYVFVLEDGARYAYPEPPSEAANCIDQLIFQAQASQ